MLVIAFSFLAGQAFFRGVVAREPDGAVLWEIDKTNWRQGGVTTVELTALRAPDPRFSNFDLTHLRKLHRVVSLDLAENDQITNKGLAALRGLDFLADLNLERMDRYRNPESGRVSRPLTDAVPDPRASAAATGSPDTLG